MAARWSRRRLKRVSWRGRNGATSAERASSRASTGVRRDTIEYGARPASPAPGKADASANTDHVGSRVRDCRVGSCERLYEQNTTSTSKRRQASTSGAWTLELDVPPHGESLYSQVGSPATIGLARGGVGTDHGFRRPKRSVASDVALRAWATEVKDDWDIYGFGQLTAHRSDLRYGAKTIGTASEARSVRLGSRLQSRRERSSGGNGGVGSHVYRPTTSGPIGRTFYLAYQLDTDRTDDTGLRRPQRHADHRCDGTRYERLPERVRRGASPPRGRSKKGWSTPMVLDSVARGSSGLIGLTFETRNDLDGAATCLGQSSIASAASGVDRLRLAKRSGTDRHFSGARTSRRRRRTRHFGSFETTRRSTAVSEDWRALTKFNFSVSGSNRGAFFSSLTFTEAVLGYRVPPSRAMIASTRSSSTRTSANVPSPGQIDCVRDAALDYSQRSHVLSVGRERTTSSRG